MLQEGIPRHTQISNRLRDQIESGEYEIDEKIPSENELAKTFDVSRVTVRKALQTLENEQLIYRCQGLGSFVKDHRSHHNFMQLTDFMEDMERAGLEASSQVLGLKPVQAGEHEATVLKVEPGATLIRLDRLRLGDGQPVAFDITWLPVFYGQLIENCDLSHNTIYGILEEKYDIPVERGCYRIEAENADDYLAEHLGVESGKALLLIDRLSFTLGDKPIYYQKRYHRTDRIVYELMAERNGGSKSGEEMPSREFTPVFNK